jgi:polyhydroxyalkanoate synthesis regulator phasin
MAERGSQLVELVQRLGRDEVRTLVDELGALWRGDSKVGDRTAARLEGLFRELGLVTRAELEDAELKVAQLEHRLWLLEHGRVTPPGA